MIVPANKEESYNINCDKKVDVTDDGDDISTDTDRPGGGFIKNPSSSGKVSKGLILGIVIISVVVIAAVIGITIWRCHSQESGSSVPIPSDSSPYNNRNIEISSNTSNT